MFLLGLLCSEERRPSFIPLCAEFKGISNSVGGPAYGLSLFLLAKYSEAAGGADLSPPPLQPALVWISFVLILLLLSVMCTGAARWLWKDHPSS